jgi:hypothetical protein
MEEHTSVTLGQQGAEAQPERLGALGLSRRSLRRLPLEFINLPARMRRLLIVVSRRRGE